LELVVEADEFIALKTPMVRRVRGRADAASPRRVDSDAGVIIVADPMGTDGRARQVAERLAERAFRAGIPEVTVLPSAATWEE
jgi:dienelactone hydrolase